jgi:hypothetical protein
MLWVPNVHHHVQKCHQLDFILSQMYPNTSTYSISLRFIILLFSHLHVSISNGIFRSDFLTKIMNTRLSLYSHFFRFLFVAKTCHLSPSGCLRTALFLFDRVFYWRTERDMGQLYPFHIITGRVPKLFFLIRLVGVESSWVHSARRPLIDLLYLLRVVMMMENLVE